MVLGPAHARLLQATMDDDLMATLG
jgi:hypothetical protein